jgi:hypothetical protein
MTSELGNPFISGFFSHALCISCQQNYGLDVHRTSLMSHFFRPRLRLMNGFRMSLQNCLRNPFLFPQ